MGPSTLRIACIGWGSLCWQPLELKTAGEWHSDGPMLPLEFARTSDEGKGRLTLVVTPDAPEVQTLWNLLSYDSIEDAREALRIRERCRPSAIAFWPGPDESKRLGGKAIAIWARGKDLDYVLWTALPPMFRGERGRRPASAEEAIEYLLSRTPAVLAEAEEYVRKAPRQVRTPFRSTFEERLGWLPID